jgi:hypothetical protein
MSDAFLIKVNVTDSVKAMQNSLRAALQRNKTYGEGVLIASRKLFRNDWNTLIVDAAQRYCYPITDTEHCQVIEQIAQSLSGKYGNILAGSHLRFGTSQKAFNLYLKFLWRLGHIPTPPHCPVDGIILRSAGIVGSWTISDSAAEYMRWIAALRQYAGRSLAEWEYEQWNSNT